MTTQVLTRNEKGQFVKKSAVPFTIETASKVFQAAELKAVRDFAVDVFENDTKKAVLKAYRILFGASYVEAYGWARKNNIL